MIEKQSALNDIRNAQRIVQNMRNWETVGETEVRDKILKTRKRILDLLSTAEAKLLYND